MKDYYTVAEFAEKKHVSRETVRRWLRNGKYPEAYIKSRRIGWVIPIKKVIKRKEREYSFSVCEALLSYAKEIADLRNKELETLKKIQACLENL